MSRTVIVIVNFNGIANTVKCLRSLHECGDTLRVVVVDNTPDDPGLDVALSVFAGVTLIRSPANLGFGGGNNLGINWAIEHTDCEFVMLLNNDAWIDPDSINRLERELDSDGSVGIVTPKIVFAEDTDKLWYGPGVVEWKFARGNVPGFKGAVNTPLADKQGYVDFASGCVMLIRRNLLMKIGGFNPHYFMYEEDTELSLRTVKHGFKILYAPEIVVRHVVQGSVRVEGDVFVDPLSPTNKHLVFYVSNIIKNRIFTLRLHGNFFQILQFAIWFPIYFVRLGLIFCTACRFDGVSALIHAVWDGFFANCTLPPTGRSKLTTPEKI